MRHLLHYLDRKNLLKMLALVTLQQLLNALGTYALAKAGLSFQNRSEFSLWAITSLALFLLAPGVNLFIRRLENQVSYKAYGIFLQNHLFSKSGLTTTWQNKNQKDRFLASTGSDASDYLGLMLFVSLDIYSFILSILLGVLALSLTIDLSLLPAFLVSGVISFLTYKKLRPSVEVASKTDQSAKIDLSGHLLKAWDNIFLNNKAIHRNYSDIFQSKMKASEKNAVESATRAELLVFILGLAAGVPILISLFWILWNPATAHQTEVLVALLATLPRQMTILGVFRNVFQSLTNLIGLEAKFEVICQGAVLQTRDLKPLIQNQEMTLNRNPLTDLQSLIENLNSNPKGRFEIRGPNGAGKSTLLLQLNLELASSFYLPTHPDLMIGHFSKSPQSSGERLLAHVDFLMNSSDAVILLDEWDANLDAVNFEKMNSALYELSKTKTVVEVRHR